MKKYFTSVSVKQLKNSKWCVIKDGNSNPSKVCLRQWEAINEGRKIATKLGCSLVIYNLEGKERRRYYM